jgi:hypothetical protein
MKINREKLIRAAELSNQPAPPQRDSEWESEGGHCGETPHVKKIGWS